MSSMVNNVKKGVKNIGTKIKDGFTDFFGIKSPSRLMMSLSKHIPGGVIEGMQSMRRKVERVTDQFSMWMTPDVPQLSMSGISRQVSSINRLASRQLDSHLTSEISVTSKQPAFINLSIGGQNFRAF